LAFLDELMPSEVRKLKQLQEETLRLRSERPRHRRATEKRDELAPFHASPEDL
jgi:hypothetical protein